MTLHEAAKRLSKSESTIRRMIKSGTLTASKIDGKYDIPEASVNAYSNGGQMDSHDDTIKFLQEQLREKDRLIEQLTKQMEQQNMIALQMTKHLEALPPPKRPSFWSRFKKRMYNDTQ